MKLELLTVADLGPHAALYCADALCRPGSDMADEFRAKMTDTPIVVAFTDRPIAWVASHEWRGLQTLEAFTAPEWRRRGIARAGALLMLATWYLDRKEPVAVFSADCVPLAKSLSFAQVCLYQRSGDDWSLTFS